MPLSGKKGFSHGVIIPYKMRKYGEGKQDILCVNRDKLVNQKKNFSANLNGKKRKPPNSLGHMLPKKKR